MHAEWKWSEHILQSDSKLSWESHTSHLELVSTRHQIAPDDEKTVCFCQPIVQNGLFTNQFHILWKRVVLIGYIAADNHFVISHKLFDDEIWLQRFASKKRGTCLQTKSLIDFDIFDDRLHKTCITKTLSQCNSLSHQPKPLLVFDLWLWLYHYGMQFHNLWPTLWILIISIPLQVWNQFLMLDCWSFRLPKNGDFERQNSRKNKKMNFQSNKIVRILNGFLSENVSRKFIKNFKSVENSLIIDQNRVMWYRVKSDRKAPDAFLGKHVAI
jgi:hypothetical protein